jgi:hypothetical protein
MGKIPTMKKQTIIRIGFFIFLFTLGYLIGGGISKTVSHLTGKIPVKNSTSL